MRSSTFLITASKKLTGLRVEVASIFHLTTLFAGFLADRIAGLLQPRPHFWTFSESVLATKATSGDQNSFFTANFQADLSTKASYY